MPSVVVGLISAELADRARGYLASVDSGEQQFEGMGLALIVSGTARAGAHARLSFVP